MQEVLRLLFDLQRIGAETFVGDCECHAVLPSTNNRALELANQQELRTPALVIAEAQSAGRGRGENVWWSAEGGLTFSLIFDAAQFGIEPEHYAQISLITGLALCEALEFFLPSGHLKVKWPNDVMLTGKKLCGILCEIPSSLKGRIVVGIGINVNNQFAQAPAEVQQRAISLSDSVENRLDLTEVLIRVLQQLETEYTQFASQSWQVFTRFRQRCWLTGRQVSIRSGVSVDIQGECRGINAAGLLLVRTPAGIQEILSGTVTTLD